MKKTAPHVLLGVTGSIAAVKSPELVRILKEKGFRVSVLMTSGATKFITPLSLATLSGEPVHVDMFGPDAHRMPHVELAHTADLLVVAPASVAVLGRMAHGLAEDLVTLTYVTTQAPVLIAPGMHDTMWLHPATQENVKILSQRKVKFVGPVKGKLADGTDSVGRMADPEEIVKAVEKLLLG